ncbi:MAG: ABC transporter permease [Blautia sp.]|nr:ABC transporter permease [Blautia sp.]MDY3998861.1 ABC transporter permease [Blautia sp.]
MKNKKFFYIGIIIVSIFVLLAVFAPWIVLYPPSEIVDVSFAKPSIRHLLGTNDIGQDIFSEIIYGTRYSLLVGLCATAVSWLIGSTVGILAGWFGGILDDILMKVTTFFITIPYFPLVIVLSASLKSSLFTTAFVLGVTSWPGMARVLRSQTMKIKSSEYITSIHGMGAGDFYLLTRHVLPEILPLIVYHVILRFKSAILSESSLSFLGLGSAVNKSWGSILYYAQAKNAFLTDAWIWWILPPGLMIVMLVFGLMMIAYGVEGIINQRLEEGNEQ